MSDYNYPAHSTEPYRTPQPVQKRTGYDISKVLKAISVFFIFVAIVGGSCAVLYEGRRTTAEGTADKVSITSGHVDTSPLGVQVGYTTGYIPHTSTPKPTATPAPTHTRYPTFTPTITHLAVVENEIIPSVGNSVYNEPIIEYVDRILEVTRIVTVVVPPTPEPKTMTPQSTWTPQPTVNLTQEYGLVQLERDKQVNRITSLGVFLLYFVVIISPIGGIIVTRNKMLSARPTMEDTIETAEDIANKYPVNDWRDELRRQRVLRLRSAGANLNQIEERIWPGAASRGGAHYVFIKSVLEECDPLGEYGPLPHPTHPDTLEGATQA